MGNFEHYFGWLSNGNDGSLVGFEQANRTDIEAWLVVGVADGVTYGYTARSDGPNWRIAYPDVGASAVYGDIQTSGTLVPGPHLDRTLRLVRFGTTTAELEPPRDACLDDFYQRLLQVIDHIMASLQTLDMISQEEIWRMISQRELALQELITDDDLARGLWDRGWELYVAGNVYRWMPPRP